MSWGEEGDASGGTVVIVDDQPITRWGLAHHLAAAGWRVVAELDDLGQLDRTLATLRPSVVVVEPALADRGQAHGSLAAILAAHPGVKALAFTSDLGPLAVEAALESGCLGVVPKTSEIDGVIAGMRDVAAGERHLHPRAIAALLQRRQSADALGTIRGLSARELGVLQLIADGRSNADIAGELGVSDATVKTHVAHVLRKLNAVDRAQAVARALRLGLFE